MKPIPLFGLGIQSRSNNVTAQKRVNMYLETVIDGEKQRTVAYRTPGLRLIMALGSPVRGWYAVNDVFYVVTGNTLYKVSTIYAVTVIGTLNTSTGPVSISTNPLELIIVDSTSGYTYNYGTLTFAEITDVGFLGGDTVTFLNSFFIVNNPDSGRFEKSASYDGTSWDATEVATAESAPDNLVAVVADHGELILLGESTTEIWAGVDAVDFPFQKAGSAIEWGCAARESVRKYDNSLVWLARNRMGSAQIIRLDGYTPNRISTYDLESIINGYSNAVLSAATAFSYMYNGHPFYQINFSESSWLYDGSNGVWSQVKGYGINRHRANYGLVFNSVLLVSDYENGNIYTLDQSTYDDNGQPLIAELQSQHVFNGGDRISFSKLWVDVETGVGLATGQGEHPQMILQVYKDKGHIPLNNRYASMGEIGEYKSRVIFTRLGQARDWVFNISVSDPVKVAIMGAYVE
jgi:hypothetical protein